MPRGRRPSRTPTPSAGPSTPYIVPSRFSLLREMLEEDNQWNSDDSGSGYSDYDYNAHGSGDDTVASSMLNLPDYMEEKKRGQKRKGKGKAAPAPKTITSSGVSKTLIRQQTTFLPKKTPVYEGDDNLHMSQDMAEKIVGTAVIKVMEEHFTTLNWKIDNLKMDVSTLMTTVTSLVEENKKLGEVRGTAPDPEKQPPATPETPKKDLTIKPRPQLEMRKRVGTPSAREIVTRNWENQVKNDNATPMNIDKSDVEPGRPGKAPRLTSPPPTFMHCRYAGASATVRRREDDSGENDKGYRTRRLPNPRKRQRCRRESSEGSCDRVTDLRNTITWRMEENDNGGRRPGGREGQTKMGESEAPEREKEKEGRPQRSLVVTKYTDDRGVTEVYDCRSGRYESWRPRQR